MDSELNGYAASKDDANRSWSIFDENWTSRSEIETNRSSGPNQRLTWTETTMLDFLLEKERRGRTDRRPSKKNEHRVRFNLPPAPIRGKRQSKEDKSVVRAIDELNQFSDNDLAKMLDECNRDEDGRADAGDFLAWWMARTQFPDRSSNASPIGRVPQEQEEPVNRVRSKQRRNPKGRNANDQSGTRAPKAIPGEPGRFVFSFMQDREEPNSTNPEEGPTSTRDFTGDLENENEPTSTSRLQDVGDGAQRSETGAMKQMKTERSSRSRRDRRDQFDKQESTVSSDFDDWPEFLVDMALTGKSKTRKKGKVPAGPFWDPETPRPMPCRLCRSKKAPEEPGESNIASEENQK